VPSTTSSNTANDQLSSDSYDANGSTTASAGKAYVYDFENHIVAVNPGGPNQISIVYDGDGNRVSKTVNGVTTKYLVDDNNPTGYAQVVEELTNGSVSRTYTYGQMVINESQLIAGNWTSSFYGMDGHGSVRFLTNSSGSVTDTYDYDAFGILIHQTGTTPNIYLYSGQQFDSDLGLYYQRARYLNAASGRFHTLDRNEGFIFKPKSLHKYGYAEGNPVDRIDPTGEVVADEMEEVEALIESAYVEEVEVESAPRP
jgi:RHS repeat-associated protein